ncbi:MAG: stage V sporulation protein AD [Bacilli bacterium]|nr:stage V sporulation protein AD [Bacilli bacterium]MDD3304596.1 stage V sporulation protein AD [Bacilli bacterium]MDD4053760.1 stage V sporulation protein AD [Bacilli bacterium]MDD4411663.1 stage V sporulation protein AD [Bacilli bacterium]
MTIKFNNVFVNGASTVTGPYESNGPLSKFFDKSYEDLYMDTNTWEQAEIKILGDSVEILLNKTKMIKEDIDLFISGDLLNQIVASNYTASYLKLPYIGIYGACSTSVEGIILGSSMLSNNQIKNCICSVSSHNTGAEKQFRNPTEYGAPKPKYSTFTCTGAGSLYLSNVKSDIKVESGTIGTTIDSGIKDVFNTGAVMAPSAADTIYRHLTDLKREPMYYDLIVTGDLGVYGKKILINYMQTEYGYDLSHNYDDCGVMLYDLEKQPVFAGASGPAASALVTYSYIINKMKKGELSRVLMVATGALMSQTTVNQKMAIPAVSHAVSLEVVE